jgi:alpha-mannosidase
MLRLEPGTLTLSAVKLAEDGAGIVVRLYNTTRQRSGATLQSALPLRRAWRARLDETALEEIPVVDGHRVECGVEPAQVVTLRLECDTRRTSS